MKVQELMERVGIKETGKAIIYIKDALEEMNMLSETHIDVERIDITENQRFYKIPNDVVKVLGVRIKNHLNSKDEYRAIPRLLFEPRVVDSDEV